MQEGGIRRWLSRFGGSGRAGLTLLVLAHVALSLPYLVSLPAFNWPDEPAHFNYLRGLAAGRGLDVMVPEAWSPTELERLKAKHFENVDPKGPEFEGIRYEAHQPPLYYALAAAVYRLVPRIEAIKLLNLALSCAVVVLSWLAGRRLFPKTPLVSWAAALFSALLPMRCFLAVSVSNGVAAELVFALLILALARGLPPAVIGVLVGCSLWVHSVALLALPAYAGWLALTARDGTKRPVDGTVRSWRPWRSWAVAAAIALILWSPWLARNVVSYGGNDPLAFVTGALSSDDAVTAALGHPRPRLGLSGPQGLMAFGQLLFNSFWGVFGWMEMFFGRWIQAFFVVLSVPPAFGLAARIRDGRSRQAIEPSGALLTWLGLTATIFLAAVIVYSLFDFQPQGRYLLTASTAFALLYGAGLVRALGRAAGPWLAVSSLGLVAVNLHGALHMVPWYLAR